LLFYTPVKYIKTFADLLLAFEIPKPKAPKIAQERKTLKHGLNFNSATIKGLALSTYQHDCTLL
jgi:hypothetical protein